jgi:hypothetical protein
MFASASANGSGERLLSYNNDFSTIFRITQFADLSVKMVPEDMDGKAPLPGYLADATIVIGQGGGGQGDSKIGGSYGQEREEQQGEDIALIERTERGP